MGRTAKILAVATLMVVFSASAALAALPVLTGTNGDAGITVQMDFHAVGAGADEGTTH